MPMVNREVNEKYYGENDTEKVDLSRLCYIFIPTLFFCLFTWSNISVELLN